MLNVNNIIKDLDISTEDLESIKKDDSNKIDNNDNDNNNNLFIVNKFKNIINKNTDNYVLIHKSKELTIYIESNEPNNPNNINPFCNKQGKYSIFITDMFDYGLESYNVLVMLLKNAQGTNIINIYINSCGGYVNSGVYILGAMQQCKAKIKTIVTNFAASMGALVWSYGDILVVDDDAIVMFHGIGSGISGKVSDMKAALDSITEINTNILKSVLDKKLITAEEYKDLLDGKDLYLLGEDLNKRLQQKIKGNK